MQLSGRALETSAKSVSRVSITLLPRPIGPTANPRLRIDIPVASGWSVSRAKRLLDFTFALLALMVLAVPMLIIGLCVRLSSKGPALFVQSRAGRGGRSFRIYKFRSMTVARSGSKAPAITCHGDHRITGVGRWLRKLKLDELPQFYNVLRGDMSLVGPRPKLPQHMAIVNLPYRPGITGAATLAFRCEEKMLSYLDPGELDAFYKQRITPFKTRIDTRYMSRATVWSDLRLLAATALACMAPLRVRTAFRNQPERIMAFQSRQPAEDRMSESLGAIN